MKKDFILDDLIKLEKEREKIREALLKIQNGILINYISNDTLREFNTLFTEYYEEVLLFHGKLCDKYWKI